MCNTCGQSICQCTPTYSYNWYNTDGQPCTTCSSTPICAKQIPAKCTIYNGVNLAGLSLSSPIDIETVIATIDVVINNIQILNQEQAAKNINILANLNDINTRLNTLAGGTPHDPYTI